MNRFFVFALLAITFINVSNAHSWLDCAKWIPNDPAAYNDVSKQRFADADGKCDGYARRFEVGIKPFGKMDEVQFYRHFHQETSPLACRRNAGGSADRGSNEGRATPISGAYSPNANRNRQTWGKMAQVYSGDRLCWRWPAKNHMGHVNVKTNMVFVNWDDVPNRATELTQAQLDTKRIAQMPFANCPVPGPPSSGDQTGVGSELRPCGGCFTIPDRAPGVYTVQWKWPFHVGVDIYSSCADIEVLAPRTTTNQNCQVSAWGSWSACSTDCGSGTTTRRRTVTQAQTGTGTACPSLTETISCNTGSCAGGLSEHVVYDDTLRGFEDWSWSTSYNLAVTTPLYMGSKSISFTPKSWQAIYFHMPGGGDVKDYQAISFWIHGGSTGGQSIKFAMVVYGAAASTPLLTYTIPTSKLVANRWNQVSLTFSSLGKTSGYFDGLWFQANSATTQGTVYIDEIYLKHIHTGGPAPLITTECDGIVCGPNSLCAGGACTCVNGFAAQEGTTDCTVAPSITDVLVTDLGGTEVTSLDNVDELMITWNTTGQVDTVSIILETTSNGLPQSIYAHTLNEGYRMWMPADTLAAGTYYIRVQYDTETYGRSSALTKTATTTNPCPSVDCNGHGICDYDTDYTCLCRYGWNGTTCETAPDDITRIAGVIDVEQPYTTVTSDPTSFNILFRADMAAALIVSTDQIEIVRYEQLPSPTMTRVYFNVLSGGEFDSAPHDFNSTTSLQHKITTMLGTSDSSLNRGVMDFSAATSTDSPTLNSATSVAPHFTAALAIILSFFYALF